MSTSNIRASDSNFANGSYSTHASSTQWLLKTDKKLLFWPVFVVLGIGFALLIAEIYLILSLIILLSVLSWSLVFINHHIRRTSINCIHGIRTVPDTLEGELLDMTSQEEIQDKKYNKSCLNNKIFELLVNQQWIKARLSQHSLLSTWIMVLEWQPLLRTASRATPEKYSCIIRLNGGINRDGFSSLNRALLTSKTESTKLN